MFMTSISPRCALRAGTLPVAGSGVPRTLALLAAAAALQTNPAGAQDEFGRMVAVSGETVLVGKPGPARGPAALYRFERDASGAWVLASSLSPPGTAESGYRLAPSMRWSGDRVVVGSADPDAEVGAHVFRSTSGGLVHETGLELFRPANPGRAVDPGAPGGAALDFPGIMRILAPPLRTVAVGRDRVAVSVAGDGASPPAVYLYQRDARRGWQPPTLVQLPGPASEYADFGAAIAFRRDEVLVSSPSADEVGRVFVFRPQDSRLGNITLAPTDSLAAGARFGATLAVDGSRMLVGAPGARGGAGLVYAYLRFDPGEWEQHQVLSLGADDGPVAPGSFGATLALLGDELWIG